MNNPEKVSFGLIQGGANGYLKMTDAELVVLCQQRDQRAFEALLKRHQKSVYALLYRVAPDWREQADDLAQEVFIRMWRSITHLRNPRAFKSWMSQIVTNLFYDECRKRPRQLRVVSMDEPVSNEDGAEEATRDIRDKAPGPEELSERQELRLVVQNAMAELPEQFRTAVMLREFHELSYEEIARITDTELGTVKSRIARARSRVQQIIKPYLADGKKVA